MNFYNKKPRFDTLKKKEAASIYKTASLIK